MIQRKRKIIRLIICTPFISGLVMLLLSSKDTKETDLNFQHDEYGYLLNQKPLSHRILFETLRKKLKAKCSRFCKENRSVWNDKYLRQQCCASHNISTAKEIILTLEERPELYFIGNDHLNIPKENITLRRFRHSVYGEQIYYVPTEPQVYHNICIDLKPGIYPYIRHIKSFDSHIKKHTILFPTDELTKKPLSPVRGWMIDIQNTSSIPKDWTLKDTIAYFPSYWRDVVQIFMFLHHTLPVVNVQLQWGLQQNLTVGQKPILVVPVLDELPISFRETIQTIGYESINDFNAFTHLKHPICFSQGVFGYSVKNHDLYIDKTNTKSAMNTLTEKWLHTFGPCKQYHVLLIQRKTNRRILDIDFLSDLFRKHGYSHVRIMSFEGLTFREQYNIIRCTSVFIAVQGAALAWYVLLPTNATLIEFVMPAWPTRYMERAKLIRPDLQRLSIQCEAKTPKAIWLKYANMWFRERTLTDDVKLKVVLRSREAYPIRKSIWKESDCWCSSGFFLEKFPYLDNYNNRTHILS